MTNIIDLAIANQPACDTPEQVIEKMAEAMHHTLYPVDDNGDFRPWSEMSYTDQEEWREMAYTAIRTYRAGMNLYYADAEKSLLEQRVNHDQP